MALIDSLSCQPFQSLCLNVSCNYSNLSRRYCRSGMEGEKNQKQREIYRRGFLFIFVNRIWIIAPVTNGFGKNFCRLDIVKVTFHSPACGLQQVGGCSTAGTVKPNISQSYKRRPFDMPEIYQKIALK